MLAISLLLVIGFMLGTLAEYGVHRLLHVVPVLARWHQKHHDDPSDYSVGGSWAAHAVGVLVIASVFSVVSVWIGLGFVVWYGVYSALHYYSHHVSASKPYLIDYFQDQHIEHHIDPTCNFGVTVPFWDLLGKTYKPGINHNKV